MLFAGSVDVQGQLLQVRPLGPLPHDGFHRAGVSEVEDRLTFELRSVRMVTVVEGFEFPPGGAELHLLGRELAHVDGGSAGPGVFFVLP